MKPCTCTLACIPAGLVSGQACRLSDFGADPEDDGAAVFHTDNEGHTDVVPAEADWTGDPQ